jgi:hypothetical protein
MKFDGMVANIEQLGIFKPVLVFFSSFVSKKCLNSYCFKTGFLKMFALKSNGILLCGRPE